MTLRREWIAPAIKGAEPVLEWSWERPMLRDDDGEEYPSPLVDVVIGVPGGARRRTFSAMGSASWALATTAARLRQVADEMDRKADELAAAEAASEPA